MRNDDALFQLGMDLEALDTLEPRSTTQTEETHKTALSADVQDRTNAQKNTSHNDLKPDHFIIRDGEVFAGSHIIIDLYEAEGLNDQSRIEKALLSCIKESGATLLHIHLHPFEPTGVSGVAVLAESHISVHTWPDQNYAAFDVFMCGDTRPECCISILKDAFNAGRVDIKELRRGVNLAHTEGMNT